MVLDLKGVFECDGYSRDVSYELDMGDYADLAGENPFKEPFKISASVRNRAGVVELHVKAQSRYFTKCDRCCAPVTENVDVVFDNVLVNNIAGEGEKGDIIAVREDSLDLDELVRSNIILNLPMKHLCKADCKGLCPVCGKNLNDGDCGCASGNDNAFSVLKNLL